MPFPVKQVPLKTILNLVKKSTFNFQAVKSLNKGFFVNYPKSGKINPVRISIQPVKIIRTLVKKIQSGKNYPKSGKENPLAVKPIKTRFSVDYPKSGKNYPNFGKINPLFQKDVKFGKENALQMPYKARYPSFQKCGKEFCPVFDFCFSAIQQHGKNYPKFGKENPDFGKNYPKFGKENSIR